MQQNSNPESEKVVVDGKMTVNADKVVVVSNAEPVDQSRSRLYAIIGTILGSIIGPVSTFFGLIFIACAEGESNKTYWKRFTSFSMLGWIVFIVLWFGGLLSFGVDSVAHTKKPNQKNDAIILVEEKAVYNNKELEVSAAPIILPLQYVVETKPVIVPVYWQPKKVIVPTNIHKIYAHQYGYCVVSDQCDGKLICVNNQCLIAK